MEVGISAHCGSSSLISVWGTLEVDSLFVICGSEGLRMSRHLVLTLALGQISLGEFSTFLSLGRYLPVALTFKTATQ